jgi:hypothetical protein
MEKEERGEKEEKVRKPPAGKKGSVVKKRKSKEIHPHGEGGVW